MTQQQNPIINYDAGETFSKGKSGNLIPGWASPWPSTPAINNNYRFPEWTNDIVVWLKNFTEPLYLFGPTGCGKTSCLKQIVAKLNYPVYEITGHSRLEFPEMVGHHTVQQGSMFFAYGPLAMAMRTGGIFLVNEVDLLDPATAAGLNSVLDGSPLTIPENGGELIVPHPMFRVVATANSNGAGDATGLYQGVLRQNIALMDRFSLVKADYLAASIEKQVILGAVPKLPDGNPAIPEDIVEKMVRFANAVRKLFIGEESEGADMSIEVTLSTRTIIRWAHLIVAYEPLKKFGIDVVLHSLERALLYRASGPTRVALTELKQRIFS